MPSAASDMNAVDVSAFVIDPMRKSVRARTGSLLFGPFVPKPWKKVTFPFSMSATAAPEAPSDLRSLSNAVANAWYFDGIGGSSSEAPASPASCASSPGGASSAGPASSPVPPSGCAEDVGEDDEEQAASAKAARVSARRRIEARSVSHAQPPRKRERRAPCAGSKPDRSWTEKGERPPWREAVGGR